MTYFNVGDEVLYTAVNPYVKAIITQTNKNGSAIKLDDGTEFACMNHSLLKVWKLESQNKFKLGDRVWWREPNNETELLGTVDYVFQNIDGYCGIKLDKPYNHCDRYDVPLDRLRLASYKMTNVAVNDFDVKCAKWYKSAYSAITKAGGVPEIVIDSIPADVLDNLIRNDLHLEYKK